MSKDEIMDASNNDKAPELSIEECVELGKRAYALQQYEDAVKHYGTALELVTEKYGDGSPETADHLLRYGKALLENAIRQSAVLSKEDGQDKDAEGDDETPNDPRFTLLGYAEDDEPVKLSELQDDEEEQEEPDAPGEGDEGGEDEDAPEDDFNAAWEVLELARVLYDKEKDEDDEIKLKLADTYLSLGDVSLETEKFEQAIDDYTSAVTLKTELLPFSSRQIAEGHLKLALVLDITSGRLSDSIRHVELSIESVEARLSELRSGTQKVPAPSVSGGSGGAGEGGESAKDTKGKGKGKVKKLIRDPSISEMTPAEIENEIKDLEGMRQELMNKLEEIRALPEEEAAGAGSSGSGATTVGGSGGGGSPKKSTTAPELAARQLDSDLSATGVKPPSFSNTQVHDLTSIVKKKKKRDVEDPLAAAAVGAGAGGANGSGGVKRKLEEETVEAAPSTEKKARVSEEPIA